MKHKFTLKLAVVVLVTCLLPACATGVSKSGSAWPTQTYEFVCRNDLPFPPICLDGADYDGGFKYRAQFKACRVDLLNFASATDFQVQCMADELRSIFNDLIDKVFKSYNCYLDHFRQGNKGEPVHCSRVEVPRFLGRYAASGVELYFGIPDCVRAGSTSLYVPKHEYELDDCKKQVDVFTDKSIWGSSFKATSAQEQYDDYIRNLENEAQENVREATDKFNCIAEGNRYCF
ncbi:hypothetical protein L2D14_02930 [Thalassospiraceae bacterium LMO-JJ14]|nr:hypothetical protein L2D14_02930 [Thalassospiraceae bacterium LMO-JJ14]